MPDQRMTADLLVVRPGEGDQLVGPREVELAPLSSTTSHVMTFSAVTQEDRSATSLRYVLSLASAEVSTAAPIRTPVGLAIWRKVAVLGSMLFQWAETFRTVPEKDR